MHWGLGPVFAYEWLTSSRRWQMYAGRSSFVALLLAGIFLVWWSHFKDQAHVRFQDLATVGESFFHAVIGTQLAVVLLAAPAATAGSICSEKSRGSLVHLLVTDLTNTEIILGKLAAHLLPVLGLIASGAPVLFLCLLLGGIDPTALVGAYLVTLAVALLGCSLALLLSVWGRKTHEVLMVNYLLWLLVLLADGLWWELKDIGWTGAPPGWLGQINPFWLAFAPYANPGTSYLGLQGMYLGAAAALSLVLALVAIACVRIIALRQASRSAARRGWLSRMLGLPRLSRWLPRPSLDRNPVLWREWRRQPPSGWITLVWTVYVLLAGSFSLLGIISWLRSPNSFLSSLTAVLASAAQICVGLLLLNIAAVTGLAEERARGNLEQLLVTPLSTNSILWGKWWGVYRTVPWLAVIPCLTAGALAFPNGTWLWVLLTGGQILSYGAAITSLGIALTIWTSRLSRALALSISIVVLITVGWPFLMFTVIDNDGLASQLAIGSPFMGVLFSTGRTAGTMADEDHYALLITILTWIIFYSLAALLLLLVTRKTFHRCLGRIPPHSRWFPGQPHGHMPGAKKLSLSPPAR